MNLDNNNTINIKGKVSLHNEFDIEVKDIRTGEIRQRGKAYNILLDGVYTALCGRLAFFTHINFGKGTGTLNTTRTNLFNQIDSVVAVSVEEIRDVTNNIYYWKRKIVLLPAQYVGETITEVGIYANTTSKVGSHALIQDSEGNQISITKTEYDEVTIYATVYFQLYDNENIKWSNLPNGNALLNYFFGNSIPTPTIQVGQSRLISTDNSIFSQLTSKNGSYTADVANKKLKTNIVRFETTEGNRDIFEIGLSNIFRTQIPVTGIWDGYNVVNEAVGTGDGINKNFNLKQNYIKLDTAVIKVDGVPMVKDVDYILSPMRKESKIAFPFLKSLSQITGSHSNPHLAFDGSTAVGYKITSFPADLIIDLETVAFYNIGIIRYLKKTTNTNVKNTIINTSVDGVVWTQVGSVEFINTNDWQEMSFTPTTSQFRYIKLTFVDGLGTSSYVDEIEFVVKGDQLVFTNPPATTAVITADYSIDHIPKDANHVLDVGFEIQFGEGSAS